MSFKIPPAASSVLSELERTLGERASGSNLQLTDATALSSHPSDSSRVLLGLMALSHKARSGPHADQELLEGVIESGVLRSLLSALHFRDSSTLHHVRRTANVATALARFLGWDGRHLKVLEVAALLHDMGKIGVPDNVLFKPAVLSPDESELMSLHYNIGLDVLQACRVDPAVLDFVGSTHSFTDGTASRFRNINEVPMGARILTIADAYDSLRTEQVYREGKSHAEVMSILVQYSGTQFDGNIVSALARCCQDEGPPDYSPGVSYPGIGSGSLGPVEALEASTLCHIFNHLYLLESLYDGFYLIDSDLRVVVWNRGLDSLLGRTAGDMLNRVWSDRELSLTDLHGEALTDGELPLQRVMATGRTVTKSLRAKHTNGDWKEIELQTVPLLDAEQRLYGVAGIVRDLSRAGRKPQEFRELRRAATLDPLTMLANRGELETQLALNLAAQQRPTPTNPFSVIFVDVDHFKSINDNYGHTVGDKVLVELARLMQQEMYSGELVARYGGEEFVILCPDTDLDTAYVRAERLRHSVTKLAIAEMPGRALTASLGVAVYEAGDSVESLLRRADEGLYLSKHGGRNRTNALKVSQLRESSEARASGESDPFLFRAEFEALVSNDMVVYKLGGFISDNDAKLAKVTPSQVVMHVGQVSFIPYWGNTASSQPVELELNIGKKVGGHNPRAVSCNTKLSVQMKPRGWVRQSGIFQQRAKQVFKDLRAFFVAETPLT
jgi:diguanylate cyclase (GGDEF)-like protein/putative nucleotidyltransferase with HDIG domain/PAS domain S-box-containing protein